MAPSTRPRVFLTLLCALWLSSRTSHASEGVAVLVPGTLNSVVPGTARSPYFSAAILESVEAAGYEAFVVKGLDPVGRLEENGETTLKSLRAGYLSRHPLKDAPITLLCHSAGGLYALYAAANAGDLPIRRIIMVSTPLQGSHLADAILGGGNAEELRGQLASYSLTVNLDGLRELGTKSVARFLTKVRLDPSIRLYAVGGSQGAPPGPLQAMDVEYLSPVFTITNGIIGSESDGIVERSSAYGRDAVIRDTDGARMNVQSLERLHANLDHAEQLLDWRVLEALGFYNAFVIERRQRNFYSEVLKASR